MAVMIQDTARNNLVRWTLNAIRGGYATGAFLSPFVSPRDSTGFKRSAIDTSNAIRTAGGEFWFDPMTYALDMPRAGDFRYYSGWPLWNGSTGDLGTRKAMRQHVSAVFALQDELGSARLAPTVLVSYPDTPKSRQALDLAETAMGVNPRSWLTVAGDQQFWAAGAELDAHIGALDQCEPDGWLFVVARNDTSMPPSATAEEVFGLMRSTFSLSQDRPVRVAFGDVAALPAIAAGASSLGTGWDMRQRICAYQDYEDRAADGGGGAWYQRPTLRGLLGGLSNNEYETLASEHPNRTARLSPGTIAPQPESAFRHHATVLAGLIDSLSPLSGRQRVDFLRESYTVALGEWPVVQRVTGAKIGPGRWISPFLDGLDLFRSSEGWT
ncbi:hypothetical protein [Mycobacterium sp. D16Q16]|uniref:hypothetical protein n=1 Tax=Mycobacterium sp. D16Q16 TaxID=1855659 RepID=UPI0009938238|nr:hypothetical protein [Mycobacterium sp. D16Q16]